MSGRAAERRATVLFGYCLSGLCPRVSDHRASVLYGKPKIVAKKREPINLMPTKPKVIFSKTKTKLQVGKQVTSIIRLGNAYNHMKC